MASIEEKILEINQLSQKFKFNWSFCYFKNHKKKINLYISPGGWEDPKAFTIRGSGLLPVLSKAIKTLHQKYMD